MVLLNQMVLIQSEYVGVNSLILSILTKSSILYFCQNDPRYEKTGFLHMRKQRRRSAAQ